MSRALRRYKHWEKEARAHAWHDARQLALDLYHSRAAPLSPYDIGVVLEPDEVLYRQVWARYRTWNPTPEMIDNRGRPFLRAAPWQDWGWSETLITSERLVSRLRTGDGRLLSIWWDQIGGVQASLPHETVVLDDRAGDWRGKYSGPAVPVIAVAAVAQMHGTHALLEHPSLARLRATSCANERLRRRARPRP